MRNNERLVILLGFCNLEKPRFKLQIHIFFYLIEIPLFSVNISYNNKQNFDDLKRLQIGARLKFVVIKANFLFGASLGMLEE